MRLRQFVTLLAVLLAASPAPAGEAVRSFAESDRNGDGSVDRREMERRALEVFYFADTDKDGHLSREEYGGLVLDEPFATVDTDHDGRISPREFVAVRTRDFDAADRNHDGVLSPEETR
jgi:Ca2+-binding EF-hand superfamily protein